MGYPRPGYRILPAQTRYLSTRLCEKKIRRVAVPRRPLPPPPHHHHHPPGARPCHHHHGPVPYLVGGRVRGVAVLLFPPRPAYMRFRIRILRVRSPDSTAVWGSPRKDIAPSPHRRVILAPKDARHTSVVLPVLDVPFLLLLHMPMILLPRRSIAPCPHRCVILAPRSGLCVGGKDRHHHIRHRHWHHRLHCHVHRRRHEHGQYIDVCVCI